MTGGLAGAGGVTAPAEVAAIARAIIHAVRFIAMPVSSGPLPLAALLLASPYPIEDNRASLLLAH
ncbi:MAG: hypothetical protein WDN06_13575 [Asticcacaulis sp.]